MGMCTEWSGEHAAVTAHNINYIDRLARYEDTGMEPEELIALLVKLASRNDPMLAPKKPAERACQDARFLRPGDKVVVKKTGDILSVTGLEGRWDDISIRCDDGNTYHHTAVQ